MRKKLLFSLLLVFVLALLAMVVTGCSLAGSGTVRGSQEFSLSVNFDGVTDANLVTPGRFTLTDRQGNEWISARLLTVADGSTTGTDGYDYLSLGGTYRTINQNGRITATGDILVTVRMSDTYFKSINWSSPPASFKWDKWLRVEFVTTLSKTLVYQGPTRASITSWGTPPTPPTTD